MRGFLRQVDAALDISPAPSDSGDEQDPGAELMQRSACKDATPSPPLRKLLSAASSQNLTSARSASSLASSGGQLPGRHSDRCASYSSLDSAQNGADLGTAPVSSQTSPSEGTGNGHAGDSEANGRRAGPGAAAESPWREKAVDGQSPSGTSSASTSRRSSVAEEEPLHGNLKLIHRDIEVREPPPPPPFAPQLQVTVACC